MTFKAAIFGDSHGEWQLTNHAMLKSRKRHPDITHWFHVGDLGHGFPNLVYNANSEVIKNKGFCEWNPVFHPVHVAPGNHDNYDRIEDPSTHDPRIIWMDRGQILDIDGYRIMFFGGAESIDKSIRTIGIDFWNQEKIEYGQVMKVLLEELKPIHCIISHEKPECFPDPNGVNKRYECGKSDRQALEALWDFFRPQFWFYGHYHDPFIAEYKGTQITCCPIINSGKWVVFDGKTITHSWIDNQCFK